MDITKLSKQLNDLSNTLKVGTPKMMEEYRKKCSPQDVKLFDEAMKQTDIINLSTKTLPDAMKDFEKFMKAHAGYTK